MKTLKVLREKITKSLLSTVLIALCNLYVHAQVHTIISFTPESGPIGTTVTITGTDFDTTPINNIVFFGATQASVSAATDTRLTVTVPMGATYQPISVLTDGLIAYSSAPFVVTFEGPDLNSDSFVEKVDFSTGAFPRSVVIGDFDGDGIADLATADRSRNTVSVLPNNSTGPGVLNFNSREAYSSGPGSLPRNIAIGDLDGDGKMDLVSANLLASSISVFRNTSASTGTISYADRVDYTVGTQPHSVAIADFDGDGRADLAVAVRDDDWVAILRNTTTSPGSISFADPVNYLVDESSAIKSIAATDLDGDRKVDLAVSEPISNSVYIFRNTSTSPGMISFAEEISFASGRGINSIAIGDVDGDNKADLATVNSVDNSTSILRNSSTGIGYINFATKVDFPLGIQCVSIALGDLDGDGKVDVTVSSESSRGLVSILKNTSSGIGNISFADRINFATGRSSFSVAIGDIDGDGMTDLVAANSSSSSVSILRHASAATDITAFEILGLETSVTINPEDHSIDLEVPFGTNSFDFVAIFNLSEAATAHIGTTEQASHTTINDFTNPVTYIITAEDGITNQEWVVTTTIAPGTATDITSFSVSEQTEAASIDAINHSVTVEVPFGTDVSELLPTFSLPLGALANIGDRPQISNGTANDFTNPLTYTIVAGNGTTTQDWIVTVTFAPNTANSITSFSLPNQTGNPIINAINHTITVEVPFGTDVSALVSRFTLSTGATTQVGNATQISNITVNDFSNLVTYTVTAEDGISIQAWGINVTLAPPSTETEIITFSIPEIASAVAIDPSTRNVVLVAPFGTDVSAMTPSFTLSPGAAANIASTLQVSGSTANDFSHPIVYTVIAEDGFSAQNWTVTITILPNTAADILSFSVSEQVGNTSINIDDHTIALKVAFDTDISTLVSNFTLSASATARVGSTTQISGHTINDFTAPVTYTIIAANETTTQDWTITIITEEITDTDILDFTLPEQISEATIDIINHTIDIDVPFGTDMSSSIATFALSTGATAQVDGAPQISNVTANDFTDPLTYNITARDELSTQNWVITIYEIGQETDITTFNLPNQTGVTTINTTNHTVSVSVPLGTDVTSLTPGFTLSSGAIARVGARTQISNSTTLDFSTPVIYNITAEDGSNSQDWTVSVTVSDVNVGEVLGLDTHNLSTPVIYPNPVLDLMTIEWREFERVIIRELTGQQVLKSTSTVLDLHHLSKGVYILTIFDQKGQSIQMKIIKR